MEWLLYCVGSLTSFVEDQTLIGVNGKKVIFLKSLDLFAAVSPLDGQQKPFDVNSMIAYHGVIETLFKQTAIIPFRFKTALKDEEDVLNMLKEKNDHYKKLIDSLDGVVEIGIRLVRAKPDQKCVSHGKSEFSKTSSTLKPGAAYLESRKAFYSTASWIQDQEREFSGLCAGHFDGLFVKFKTEATRLPEVQNRKDLTLISIYFLVRKDLVQKFTAKFREIRSEVSGKMLLSGPWPPYNFVVS